jgi:hypothetical protein
VYYTVDGSEPTEDSMRALGYIGISGPLTLKAVAVLAGTASQIMTERYEVALAPEDWPVFVAPPSFSAISGEADAIHCAWTPSFPPAENYELYYMEGNHTAEVLLAQGIKVDCGADASAVLRGLSPNGPYSFLVRAAKRGYQDRDSAVQVHTFDPAPFNAPSALTAGNGVNGMLCSWTPSAPPADRYELYCRAGNFTSPEAIIQGGFQAYSGPDTAYTLNSLSFGEVYSFAARAVKRGRLDGDSNAAALERRLPSAVIDMAENNPAAAGIGWTYENGVYTIWSHADVTVTGDNGGSGRRIVVAPNAQAVNITLAGAAITGGAGNGESPLTVSAGADLRLTLRESTQNVLTARGVNAGLRVTQTGNLAVRGGGKLTAQGSSTVFDSGAGAGIGGAGFWAARDAGVISIQDAAVVEAVSVGFGAAIGGGGIGANNSVGGGTITISGGTVTAQGNMSGQGAGIGVGGNGTIAISGGTVNAQSGNSGFGIGCDSGTIAISGGTVSVQSGGGGVGIGSRNSGGTIIISGGTIIAQGGEAGIGGGASLTLNNGHPVIFASSITGTSGLPGAAGSSAVYGILQGASEVAASFGGGFPNDPVNNVTITLLVDMTVPAGGTLTLAPKMTLNRNGKTITVNGSIVNNGGTDSN